MALNRLVLICLSMNKAQSSCPPPKKTLKIIIITFEDQMDTLNNDFQVKLLFGSKGSEDHIMHLMGCDIFKCHYIFFLVYVTFNQLKSFSTYS